MRPIFSFRVTKFRTQRNSESNTNVTLVDYLYPLDGRVARLYLAKLHTNLSIRRLAAHLFSVIFKLQLSRFLPSRERKE